MTGGAGADAADGAAGGAVHGLVVGVGGEPAVRAIELPEPGSDEIRLTIHYSALNRADLLQLRGLYPPPAGESPIPGLECSGVVTAIGEGVSSCAVGDRVCCLLAGGGHATAAVVPEGQVLPVPEGLGLRQAAAVPEVGVTAWTNLVYEGGLARGHRLLILGAASGVGTFAVQVARELGAEVFVAGRSLERLERLRPLGADHCLTLGDDLPRRVRELTGDRGVDLVLDLVGGPHVAAGLAALRERGRLVLVGLLAGAHQELDLASILRRRLELRGSVLRSRSRSEKAGLVQSFGEFALPRLAAGSLRPVIDRELAFADVLEAYRQLEAGGVLGKILLRMPAAGSDGPGGD